MQWPPTSPGWNSGSSIGAAPPSSTSQIDMPSFEKIWVISFMKAMLMSRWAFSITLAASAALIERGAEDAAAGDRAVDLRRAAR